MSHLEDYENNGIESDLLLRIGEGDKVAFSYLFDMYHNKMFRFLLKVTHSESTSQDLVQDIFLKLWQNRERISEIDNINAYLFRMAQNHALNEMERFTKRTLSLSESHLEDYVTYSTPLETLISNEVKEKLAEAIKKLSPQQQRVFVLHKEEGYSYAEIADRLNLSVSTIHNHMHQALIKLRHYMANTYTNLLLISITILSCC
ncbi:MAG: RNA polymerase sigma-70 factor [Petrimonas sp.]|nr:RNA polymerase sigma-70 factor [Petrimonas sp.]